MAHTRAQLREAIRQLSNTQNNTGFVSDSELNDRIDEAKSDLYDIIIGAYEMHYASVTSSFTLAGGPTGNTFTLPTNWYKTLGLDFQIGAGVWRSVRAMGAFADRNDDQFRRYLETGLTVSVNPPTFAAGTYQFWYTPTITLIRSITHGTDSVVGSTKTWTFTNGAFSSSDIGGDLIVGSTSNSANTGIFPIVSTPSATTVVTTGSPVTETFGATVTAEVRPALDQIMDVWYELIEVLAAVKVLDKQELNSDPMQARAAQLTARITAMARNRRGEPKQAPMADGRARSRFPGIWDDR